MRIAKGAHPRILHCVRFYQKTGDLARYADFLSGVYYITQIAQETLSFDKIKGSARARVITKVKQEKKDDF